MLRRNAFHAFALLCFAISSYSVTLASAAEASDQASAKALSPSQSLPRQGSLARSASSSQASPPLSPDSHRSAPSLTSSHHTSRQPSVSSSNGEGYAKSASVGASSSSSFDHRLYLTASSRSSSVRNASSATAERSANNMRNSIASGHLHAAQRHSGNAMGRALLSVPVGLGGVGVSLMGTAREAAHGHLTKASGHLADALVLKPAATLAMATGGTLSSCKDAMVQSCKSAWQLGNKVTDGIGLRKKRTSGVGETYEQRTARRQSQAVKAAETKDKSFREANVARSNTRGAWRSMLSSERFPTAVRQNFAHKTASSKPSSVHHVDHLHGSTP